MVDWIKIIGLLIIAVILGLIYQTAIDIKKLYRWLRKMITGKSGLEYLDKYRIDKND